MAGKNAWAKLGMAQAEGNRLASNDILRSASQSYNRVIADGGTHAGGQMAARATARGMGMNPDTGHAHEGRDKAMGKSAHAKMKAREATKSAETNVVQKSNAARAQIRKRDTAMPDVTHEEIRLAALKRESPKDQDSLLAMFGLNAPRSHEENKILAQYDKMRAAPATLPQRQAINMMKDGAEATMVGSSFRLPGNKRISAATMKALDVRGWAEPVIITRSDGKGGTIKDFDYHRYVVTKDGLTKLDRGAKPGNVAPKAHEPKRTEAPKPPAQPPAPRAPLNAPTPQKAAAYERNKPAVVDKGGRYLVAVPNNSYRVGDKGVREFALKASADAFAKGSVSGRTLARADTPEGHIARQAIDRYARIVSSRTNPAIAAMQAKKALRTEKWLEGRADKVNARATRTAMVARARMEKGLELRKNAESVRRGKAKVKGDRAAAAERIQAKAERLVQDGMRINDSVKRGGDVKYNREWRKAYKARYGHEYGSQY